MDNEKLFTVAQCLSCGKFIKIAKGNHHPWCYCTSDQFDWVTATVEMPEAAADAYIEVCGE